MEKTHDTWSIGLSRWTAAAVPSHTPSSMIGMNENSVSSSVAGKNAAMASRTGSRAACD